MDVNILSEIRQGLETLITTAGIITLLWIAPSLPISWLKKLLWVSVALGLWMVLVEPYRLQLEALLIYTGCVFVYPMITAATANFIYSSLLFFITFKLMLWVFEIHAPHSQHSGGHNDHSKK